jgi:hypothetical protein
MNERLPMEEGIRQIQELADKYGMSYHIETSRSIEKYHLSETWTHEKFGRKVYHIEIKGVE